MLKIVKTAEQVKSEEQAKRAEQIKKEKLARAKARREAPLKQYPFKKLADLIITTDLAA